MIIIADDSYWDEVADYVQGSCYSDQEIAAVFQMDQEREDLIGEKMFDHDLIVCPECGWWQESGEIGNCSTHEGMCDDCCDDQGVDHA